MLNAKQIEALKKLAAGNAVYVKGARAQFADGTTFNLHMAWKMMEMGYVNYKRNSPDKGFMPGDFWYITEAGKAAINA